MKGISRPFADDDKVNTAHEAFQCSKQKLICHANKELQISQATASQEG
jgi:hypothetical protein